MCFVLVTNEPVSNAIFVVWPLLTNDVIHAHDKLHISAIMNMYKHEWNMFTIYVLAEIKRLTDY